MRRSLSEVEKKRTFSEVPLENIPPDMAIANGNLFNAFTDYSLRKGPLHEDHFPSEIL